MSFLKKLFSNREKQAKQVGKQFTDEQHEAYYTLKEKGLANILGKMGPFVGHAIIPFSVGGAVDMYYYPNHIKGTGFATMELLEIDGKSPLENRLGTYELVAFTKHDYNNNNEGVQTPFNLIERRACGFLTQIGMYSFQAVLNPNETIEVPNGEGKENTCLILDNYMHEKEFMIGDNKHHLLLCLEIFRSEMDYARNNGSDELFKLLKQKGYYPYSDLDREPVA